jgi:LPS-assembly lipoprotein
LIYGLTGGGGGASPTHRLNIDLRASQQQIVVDASSGRADVQNYGIDATYTLTELATNKVVVRSATSARVSFNIPGQQQRFAGERGLRDAETRAAGVISEAIRSRLASYFTAGT